MVSDVKCLEVSLQALDRGEEGPERIPAVEMDSISHCMVNPI